VHAAAEHAGDGVIALGGGSAIDLGKAISAEADVPVVSVPTTYSGAEWTSFYGIRDPGRKMRGGGAGAHLGGVVYEPELTLSLPRAETVGTALNALAHSAEALYVEGHNPEADEHALTGARLIGEWLPRVVDAPQDLEGRTKLLEGAMHSGMALGGSMLALGHAIAQALGGRYGLPHGAMNALALPAALRFNTEVAPEAVRRFGEALGTDDPATRSKSSRDWADSSACGTSECPRKNWSRLRKLRPAERATRPTRSLPPRPRSTRCCSRSTDARGRARRTADSSRA
jgi:alcohol dehydrogenase class IV